MKPHMISGLVIFKSNSENASKCVIFGPEPLEAHNNAIRLQNRLLYAKSCPSSNLPQLDEVEQLLRTQGTRTMAKKAIKAKTSFKHIR